MSKQPSVAKTATLQKEATAVAVATWPPEEPKSKYVYFVIPLALLLGVLLLVAFFDEAVQLFSRAAEAFIIFCLDISRLVTTGQWR